MKHVILLSRFLLAALVLMLINSCERHPGCTDPNATNYNVNAQVDNGTCQYAVTFYFDENGPNAVVNINNQSANITANYQNGSPACGINATGCANFTLPVGSYPYTASSSLTSWNGTVVVNGSGCQDVLLPQSTGSVVFYNTTNYGVVTVSINGASGQITSYITSGTPTCGFSGCATFDLPPNVSYNYTASNGNGVTWSGSIIPTADQCSQVLLQ